MPSRYGADSTRSPQIMHAELSLDLFTDIDSRPDYLRDAKIVITCGLKSVAPVTNPALPTARIFRRLSAGRHLLSD